MIKNIFIASSLGLLLFTGCSTKEEIVIINEKGKYGALKDDRGVVIKPIYDELSNFDDKQNKNTKIEHPHVLNLHWLHNYYGDEYAIAEYEGKYGVVNKKNEMIVKPIYDSISKLFNGFSIIKLDNKYGYMDEKFDVVQKPIFKAAREFLGNITFVQSNTNNKWSCITKDMTLKINEEYDEVYNLYNGFSRVVKANKWGFVDNNCNIVVEPIYDYAYNFSKGFAKVIKNKQVAYIDDKGKQITKNIFTQGENF